MTQTPRNRLLLSLPPASRDRLLADCEWIDLPVRRTLVEPFRRTQDVYFLESGLASAVATCQQGDEQIEVGHIGFEGMTGHHTLLGLDRTPVHTFMQVKGSGLRLPVDRLLAAVEDDRALRLHLLRYIHTYQIQLAYSALANGRYTIPQRLARWLLMCHDRLGTDDMRLTHDFLALMLGVRRSGVTNEIHVLEGEHAIRATRALVTVRDRARLEAMAGGCYGLPEAEYESAVIGGAALGDERGLLLDGKRILVVEDEYELATEMGVELRERGASIVGPAPSVRDALSLAASTADLDSAVIDINLQGEMAFPLAEELRRRGVPFVFVSGYQRDIVPEPFADVAFFSKPVSTTDIVRALSGSVPRSRLAQTP